MNNLAHAQRATISVILRTYNEEEYLEECLKRVFSQKTTLPFEVIVIDSESTDRTISIAEKFPTRILRIKKSTFSYGGALNTAIEQATGEYMVFLSGHALPFDDSWLQHLVSGFDEQTAGVFGKQIPAENANPLIRRLVSETYTDQQTVVFSNANAAIRKEVWELVPFDESALYTDDVFWANEVTNRGYAIRYDPQAVVLHSHNDSFKKVLSRYRLELIDRRRGRNTFSGYLNDSVHNLHDDLKYVIENGHPIYWVFYCFLLFFIKLWACFLVWLSEHKRR